MNELDENGWDALEGYLCSLTLNQERHALVRIELSRRVDVDGYIFTPGVYVREPIQSNGLKMDNGSTHTKG